MKQDRFGNFPHRDGEARGKPETRDETRWSIKTSISCQTSSNFHTVQLQNRRFPTSFLMNTAICYLKIDVSCEASVNLKTGTHLLKTSQKYCPCHTKRFLTRYETCWNLTKCHACHATRGYATFETSKRDPFCKTRHRHGHTALTRTVADGCERSQL